MSERLAVIRDFERGVLGGKTSQGRAASGRSPGGVLRTAAAASSTGAGVSDVSLIVSSPLPANSKTEPQIAHQLAADAGIHLHSNAELLGAIA